MRCSSTMLMLLFVCTFILPAAAQTPAMPQGGTRSAHLYTDLYKTDFDQPFRKMQAGLEAVFQMNEKLAVTAGVEIWNREPTPLVSLGNRFYPFGNSFVNYRALIGRNADVGIGMGHHLTLGKKFLLLGTMDYYLDQREIGFRLGLGYLWKNDD